MSSHTPPSLGDSISAPSDAVPQAQPNNNTDDPGVSNLFPRLWRWSTTDNNLSLYGFRRFKTSHLLNLRFLEEEVAELDHKIYQAGLSLGLEPTPSDRLGLRHSKIDANVPRIEDTIRTELVLRLRSTIKEYGKFNVELLGGLKLIWACNRRRRTHVIQPNYGHGNVFTT